MPIYTFKCRQDEHEFEKSLPFVDRDGPVECPLCMGDARRVYRFTGIVYAPTAGGMR